MIHEGAKVASASAMHSVKQRLPIEYIKGGIIKEEFDCSRYVVVDIAWTRRRNLQSLKHSSPREVSVVGTTTSSTDELAKQLFSIRFNRQFG
jgi:hypothetical protein